MAAGYHDFSNAAGDAAQPSRPQVACRRTGVLKVNSRPPLAYKNEEFLKRSDSRPLRILSEYLEPLSHFRKQQISDTIVFFGSARIREDGPLARYYEEARQLAGLVTT